MQFEVAVGEKEDKGKIDLASSGSLPTWPQKPGKDQSENRSLEFNSGFPSKWQGPNIWSPNRTFPGTLSERWTGSSAARV